MYVVQLKLAVRNRRDARARGETECILYTNITPNIIDMREFVSLNRVYDYRRIERVDEKVDEQSTML